MHVALTSRSYVISSSPYAWSLNKYPAMALEVSPGAEFDSGVIWYYRNILALWSHVAAFFRAGLQVKITFWDSSLRSYRRFLTSARHKLSRARWQELLPISESYIPPSPLLHEIGLMKHRVKPKSIKFRTYFSSRLRLPLHTQQILCTAWRISKVIISRSLSRSDGRMDNLGR